MGFKNCCAIFVASWLMQKEGVKADVMNGAYAKLEDDSKRSDDGRL